MYAKRLQQIYKVLDYLVCLMLATCVEKFKQEMIDIFEMIDLHMLEEICQRNPYEVNLEE